MSEAKKQPWREVFEQIVANCKIKSRDAVSERDGSGSSVALWGSQKRLLDEMAEGMEQGVRTFVILKSRQLGITTICLMLDVAWLAMHPGTNGALVVHNGGAKEKMRTDIQDIVASFPPKFFGKAFAIKKGRNNRDFMEFTNGSRLNFIVAGEKDENKETFGDGSGYNLCHFTECALYGSAKALSSFEQTLSTTHPHRLYVYESRAAGFNHWRQMWQNAGRDYHTIRRIFIGWWSREDQVIKREDRRFANYGFAHPDGEESALMNQVWHLYKHKITPEQLAWYRHRASDEKATAEIMHAQQPWDETQAFVAGGYSFFSAKDITDGLIRIQDDTANEYTFSAYRYNIGNDFFATFLEELDGRAPREMRQLRVWRKPVRGAQYVIGMDPAFGRNDNQDRHAISVWRCYADKLEQVAEFADSSMITGQAAWVLCHLAGSYEDCIINLELSGGPGHMVMMGLEHTRKLLTAEMFESRVKDRNLDEFMASARWYLYRRPDSMGAGYVANSMTTGSTKVPMMEGFRSAFRGQQLIVRSEPLLREMMDIRQDGIRIEAPGHNKDDRVVSGALAVRAWRDWRQPALISTGATYESQQAIDNGGAPEFGSVLNGFVRNYLQVREEMEEEAPRAPQWMINRGLA